MKTFIATFWRGNPQHKNGGYETTREIRAKTIENATKQAKSKKYTDCLYGSMTFLSIKEKE